MERTTKLLLVDDNRANLAILEEIFEEGFEIRSAACGEEALEILEGFKPDIMLLDIMMPGIDGYEVCRRVREIEDLQYVKIIMVSARAMIGERLKAYDLGADDYVTKPFDEDELMSKVRVFQRLKTAEEVSHLKNDVLSLVGHEVQTPLRCITVPAEMLKNDPCMSQEQIQRLGEVIRANARRLQQFFSKVQLLSDIRSGGWMPTRKQVDLSGLLREVIEDARSFAAKRGIQIQEEIQSGAAISLDPEAVRRAISHLLDNALRFSEEGGEVRVSLERDGELAAVSIVDHGRGIAADLLPRVFDEFADAESKHYSDGPGLSLALTREIVRRHGGEVSARSEPGAETVFTIRLPVHSRGREVLSAVSASRGEGRS